MSRVSFYTRPYDRLEPYDGKLSRTVLRGGAGSNASLLPDIRSEKDVLKVVNTLIVNTKGEGEKSAEDFWVKAERLLYCALIGYIWYEAPAEEMNFTTLLELINVGLLRYQRPLDESRLHRGDCFPEKRLPFQNRHDWRKEAGGLDCGGGTA